MPQIPAQLQFDEVFVVSDLHFGGEQGFQIFGSTTEFVALLEHVKSLPKDIRAALVINGDFIDFLAEKPHAHFDPHSAIAKLDRIARDPTFAPIFAGIQAMLQTVNRSLLINLGNHDLELALPWVRERLLDHLTAETAARARVYFVLDGTGLRISVGGVTALILHGNEFDAWNATDYHHLRKLTRDLQFGAPVESWVPNAGSRMVIELMNEIKKTRPFVDLLKPEREGVGKVLAMLDSGLLPELTAIAEFAFRSVKDAVRMKLDLLASDSTQRKSAMLTEDEFFAQLESTQASAYSESEKLGLWSAAVARLKGKSETEVLRSALQELMKDQSFDLRDSDDTHRAATAKTIASIPFLITGHTHLLRAIKRVNGAYFNCGTWARLIQVEPGYLKDEASFTPVFAACNAQTMPELDAISNGAAKIVQRLCPIVHLKSHAHGCIGRIMLLESGTPIALPDTEFEGKAHG